MSAAPTRRRFQLEMGTVLWMMTIAAIGLFGIHERQLHVQYQAVAETNPSKTYQVQLERLNALLQQELRRAHQPHPDFTEAPLVIVPNPCAKMSW